MIPCDILHLIKTYAEGHFAQCIGCGNVVSVDSQSEGQITTICDGFVSCEQCNLEICNFCFSLNRKSSAETPDLCQSCEATFLMR